MRFSNRAGPGREKQKIIEIDLTSSSDEREFDVAFRERGGRSAGASASVSAKPAPVIKTGAKKAGAASASQKMRAKSKKSREERNKSKWSTREGKKVAGGAGKLDLTLISTVPRGTGAVRSSSAASSEEGPADSRGSSPKRPRRGNVPAREMHPRTGADTFRTEAERHPRIHFGNADRGPSQVAQAPKRRRAQAPGRSPKRRRAGSTSR